MEITTESHVVFNTSILTTLIDDEIGMMNINKGMYFTLNSVGKSVWNLLDEKILVDEVINKLKNEYEVEYDVCKNDVLELLELLEKNDLIDVLDN